MDYHKIKNFLFIGIIALMISVGVICYVYITALKTIQRWRR
jgi:hypothetical protein